MSSHTHEGDSTGLPERVFSSVVKQLTPSDTFAKTTRVFDLSVLKDDPPGSEWIQQHRAGWFLQQEAAKIAMWIVGCSDLTLDENHRNRIRARQWFDRNNGRLTFEILLHIIEIASQVKVLDHAALSRESRHSQTYRANAVIVTVWERLCAEAKACGQTAIKNQAVARIQNALAAQGLHLEATTIRKKLRGESFEKLRDSLDLRVSPI